MSVKDWVGELVAVLLPLALSDNVPDVDADCVPDSVGDEVGLKVPVPLDDSVPEDDKLPVPDTERDADEVPEGRSQGCRRG